MSDTPKLFQDERRDEGFASGWLLGGLMASMLHYGWRDVVITWLVMLPLLWARRRLARKISPPSRATASPVQRPEAP